MTLEEIGSMLAYGFIGAMSGMALWDGMKLAWGWWRAPRGDADTHIQTELERHDWVNGGDGRYQGGAVWAVHGDTEPRDHVLVIYTHEKKFVLWPLGVSYTCHRVIGAGATAAYFSQHQLVRALAGCTFVGAIQHSDEARRLCRAAFEPRGFDAATHPPLKLPADRRASIERAIEADDGACSTVPPPEDDPPEFVPRGGLPLGYPRPQGTPPPPPKRSAGA